LVLFCATRARATSWTLAQQDILNLDCTLTPPTTAGASITSAVAQGNGVLFTVSLSGRGSQLYRASTNLSCGAGRLVGYPLSTHDNFVLQYTLMTASPGPNAYVTVGSLVNQSNHLYSFIPVRVGGQYANGIDARTPTCDPTQSSSCTPITSTTLGFVVAIESDATDWPAGALTIQLLVSPAPYARPITNPTAPLRTTKVGAYQNHADWVVDANGDGTWDAGDLYSTLATGAGDIGIVGDWNGDGRQKIGIYHGGFWLLDYNGNGMWDGTSIDRLITIGGNPGEIPVVGDWNGDGRAKVGVYVNGFWLLDYNGNGRWDGPSGGDVVAGFGGAPNDSPVVGDWNGDGHDKIGVYRNGVQFILDYNGNFLYDAGDVVAPWGQAGDVAVVGDWNGDGRTKIGVNRQGFWILDYNGNFVWDGTSVDRLIALGGNPGETPIVGDWSGNGVSKVGFYYKGFWALDYNGNGVWDGPGGGDRLIAFGGAAVEQAVPGKY
jgi:hypothetical protein